MKTSYLTEAKILKCISENPGISGVQIYRKVGDYSQQTIYNRLKWIKNNEYLSQFLTREKEGNKVLYSFDIDSMIEDINRGLKEKDIDSEMSKEDLLSTFYSVVWSQRVEVSD